MNPRRWVHRSAWIVSWVAVAWFAVPAGAQFAEPSRQSADLPPDPIARSARLLGMGRLTLLADRDNRIHLWDFAGNPVGILDADSVSTLTLRPSTTSASSSVDQPGAYGDIELQEAASRNSRFHIEAFRRPGTGTSYGIVGELTQLRTDALYSATSERRSQYSNPLGIPMVAGQLPFLDRERTRYAIYGIFGLNDSRDEYRRLSENATGRYVDHSGTLMAPPNYFEPEEYFVRRLGGGASLAYQAARSLQVSIGGNIVSNGIVGTNEGDRYASEVRERRPIYTGQGTLIGKLGESLEWGADGQMWVSARSQATWVFTISPSGGPGPSRPPLSGRGDLAKRKEEGNRIRLRSRWSAGSLDLGGSFGAAYRKTQVTPAPLSASNSFNLFRLRAYSEIAAADTIGFPEDVLSSTVEQRDWEGAGGLATRLPGGRGVVAAEFHYVQRSTESLTGQGAIAEEIFGAPPIASETKGVLWDVRSGIEYRCTDIFTGRAGYIYRTLDEDAETKMNEYLSQTVTAGIGLRPFGARWNLEAGYAFEWGQADFGSPVRPRSTRQQLGVQLQWAF